MSSRQDDAVDGRLVVNPAEQATLARIRDLRAAGVGYHKPPPSSTPKGGRRSVAGRDKLRASARSSVRRRRRRAAANRCQLGLDTHTALSTRP